MMRRFSLRGKEERVMMSGRGKKIGAKNKLHARSIATGESTWRVILATSKSNN